MEGEIRLDKNFGIPWFHYRVNETQIWVKGYAFYGDIFFENATLAEFFNHYTTSSEDHITTLLRKLNGNFAVVYQSKNLLFASVDKIRSIPLFYRQKGPRYYVSDSAEWIREVSGDQVIDDFALKEFLLTGYVTGSETLFPDIKQVQAGEYIIFSLQETIDEIKKVRYFEWLHTSEQDKDEEKLKKELDQVHIEVFSRLIASVSGKPMIIPLSGGYDSRLIVTMLKRLGYQNVICFSYGTRHNWEAEISKKVADRLGYKWLFLPWTHQRWRNWIQSNKMRDYITYSFELSTLPLLQDWPVVWEMSDRELIPSDAFFIPGLSGDFVAGSHIPKYYSKITDVTVQQVVKDIWKKHFVFWGWDQKNGSFPKYIENKVKLIMSNPTIVDSKEAANRFELWDWQERQAKFIVNSLRAYEFWNYSWRIPMWDSEIMDYWSTIPLDLRVGKRIYDSYVIELFKNYGINFRNLRANIESLPKVGWFFRLFDTRLGGYSFRNYLDWWNTYAHCFNTNVINLKRIMKIDNIETSLVYKQKLEKFLF
jgi:asparagine synthase (glutamine-hydrolysing)